MNKKSLPHLITVFSVIILVVLGLACASTPKPHPEDAEPLTKEDGKLLGENFRFYVSSNITLEWVERWTDIIGATRTTGNTTVIDIVRRKIIYVNADTVGRLLDGDVNTALNVYFENPTKWNLKSRPNIPKPPTLTFLEKTAGGLFYFKYEDNVYDENGRRLVHAVKYDGEIYEVKWEGKEEPFLKYERLLDEKTNRRTLKGAR
jgi:hypothetical protein